MVGQYALRPLRIAELFLSYILSSYTLCVEERQLNLRSQCIVSFVILDTVHVNVFAHSTYTGTLLALHTLPCLCKPWN